VISGLGFHRHNHTATPMLTTAAHAQAHARDWRPSAACHPHLNTKNAATATKNQHEGLAGIGYVLSVCEFQQHVGMARLIEWTPTGEILAAQLHLDQIPKRPPSAH
jgi:hypothetical protein